MKTKTNIPANLNTKVASDIIYTLAHDDARINLNSIYLIGGDTRITATVTVELKWLSPFVETLDLGTFTTYKDMNRNLVEQIIKLFRKRDENDLGADMMTKAVHEFDADENEMAGADYLDIVQEAAELAKRLHGLADALDAPAAKKYAAKAA